MENKTWLDALYNHPRRDEILQNFISSYTPGDDIEIKNVVVSTNENGENILDVTYTTLYYMTQLLPKEIAHCDMSDKPLEIHLIIGEYFAHEQGENIVKTTAPVIKKNQHLRNIHYLHKSNTPPTYIFNEEGRMTGDGKNTHILMKIIEKLNDGITINNETHRQMIERKTKPIMEKMIEENPSKKDRYEAWWNNYFGDRFLQPLNKFLNMDGLFEDDILPRRF